VIRNVAYTLDHAHCHHKIAVTSPGAEVRDRTVELAKSIRLKYSKIKILSSVYQHREREAKHAAALAEIAKRKQDKGRLMGLLSAEQRILIESMVGDDQVLDDKGQAALMRLAQPSAVNSSATLPKPVALFHEVRAKGQHGRSPTNGHSPMQGKQLAAGPASANTMVSAYPPVVPNANDIAKDVILTSEHLASPPSHASCTTLNIRINRRSLCMRVCVRILNGLGLGLGGGCVDGCVGGLLEFY